MNYSDFRNIFDETCFPLDQTKLVEYTNDGVLIQQALLDDNGVGSYLLMRIDPNQKDPFPYFKQGEPYHLKRICDYFVLVNKGNAWHVMLVEMKSGGGNALQQLENSQCFWEFVLNSAKRKSVDVSNFGATIRVKLHLPKKTKTKMELPKYEHDTNCIIYHWKNFCLKNVLQIASENHLI